MNYRHGYHAGNFADVLKHVALVALLTRLMAKNKPLLVLDTHAGRGGYDLTGAQGDTTREWKRGVGLLLPMRSPPDAIADYLDLVRRYDRKFGFAGKPPEGLSHYPGSPRLVRALLRSGDRFVAAELHQGEYRLLRREFAGDPMVERSEERV